jgi:hypothetical protein
MASSTDLAESSQALFCALADFIGIPTINGKFKLNPKSATINNVFDIDDESNNTYKLFSSNWSKKYPRTSIESLFQKYVKSGKASFSEIEKFLTGSGVKDKVALGWFKSSILIGKYLVIKINTISSQFKYIQDEGITATKIFYAHQDNTIMDNIQILFSEANKNQKELRDKISKNSAQVPFGNLNKWSPADIYLSTKKAEKAIEDLVKNKKGLTFLGKDGLNNFISNLIKTGQLLPLSLKKTTKSVKLEKVNFVRATEEAAINKVSFGGLSNWRPYDASEQKPSARDLKAYLSKDKTDYVFFRHDPSGNSGGAFRGEIQIKGAEAKAGGLGTGQIEAILNLCDPKRGRFGTLFKNKLDTATTNFQKQKKPIREKYEKDGAPKNGPIREEYDRQVGQLSAELVTNVVMPYLIKFLSDDERASSFTRWVFQYATSRQKNSSKYVIAKGS